MNELVGLISPKLIQFLDYPLSYCPIKNIISLETSAEESVECRTMKLELLFQKWRESGNIPCLKGWRSERYAVFGANGVLIHVERSACGLMGVRTYGCHLNGYVLDNGIKMWVAKRALTKSTYPGMLDQIAAGGLEATSKPFPTMIKECYEEAGIKPNLLTNLKIVGSVSFWEQKEFQIQPATNYVFDVELTKEFIPTPVDGEVQEFTLLEINEVWNLLLDGKFKPEASLVIVDFLIRHGLILAEEPGYSKIVALLHRSFPFAEPIF